MFMFTTRRDREALALAVEKLTKRCGKCGESTTEEENSGSFSMHLWRRANNTDYAVGSLAETQRYLAIGMVTLTLAIVFLLRRIVALEGKVFGVPVA